MTRTETMQQARGTAADLAAVNPVPLDGQIVVERDTLRLKVGDGVRTWTALPYVVPTFAAVASTGAYADLSGTPPGGVAIAQASPSASWVITHTLGRLPDVAVYVAGELVEADVTATTTAVSVAFPSPTAGVAVLT